MVLGPLMKGVKLIHRASKRRPALRSRSLNMASSSSTMRFSEQTSDLSCQTKPEMESSRDRHWSNLSYSNKSSAHWSVETNIEHYNLLKKQWGRFFRDFPTLDLGKKISEGAQADIYEARRPRYGDFNLVAKVMKGDAPLQAFQVQWPVGMLSASKDYIVNSETNLPLMTILGGTLLEDERLKGRFAFVMNRRWGDLRLLIDRRMKLERRSTVGPFFIDQVIQVMLRIAEDMRGLHNNHDIIHRDLKASNVLVWGKFGDNVDVVAPSKDEKIGCVVADFECSVGVLGTGWWRAPEILQQLRGRVPSSKLQFLRESDIYSYGMTSYEIVSGRVPFQDSFEGWSAFEAIDEVLNGRRPKLPDELPSFLKSIIQSCWQTDPKKRPTFSAICMMLKNPTDVVIDNESKLEVTYIKVEQWSKPQPLTLLQALERLLQMQVWVSEAKTTPNWRFRRSPTETIVQCFKVTDGEGRKICNEDILANIVKVLSLPVKAEQIAKNSDDADTSIKSYLIHIKSKTRESSLLGRVSAILSGMSIQVYDVRCWNHNALLECDIYVEGGKVESLSLPQILAQEAASREAPVDCNIALWKLPSREEIFNVHLENPYDGATSFVKFLLENFPDHTVWEAYRVQISSDAAGGPSLLRRISAISTEMKIQVDEARFRSHTGCVQFAVSVNADILDAMLRRFLTKEGGSGAPVDCKIVVRKLASRGVDWVDFLDDKSSDLRAPPAMRIHVGINDSEFLPVRVICPERPEILVDVACSFLNSSIAIERYEVPLYRGIKVPRSCMVEDTYFQNDDDGGRRIRFKDFVMRRLKLRWNIHVFRIFENDTEKRIKLRDHVDKHHSNGDKVELICKVGLSNLTRHLHTNSLFFSTLDVVWPHNHKKGLITLFVASDSISTK